MVNLLQKNAEKGNDDLISRGFPRYDLSMTNPDSSTGIKDRNDSISRRSRERIIKGSTHTRNVNTRVYRSIDGIYDE